MGSRVTARIALGLGVPAALIIGGGGGALAVSGPAGSGRGAPACSVHWVGHATQPLWTTPGNWSTGRVPGPASDVCVGTGADVLTNVPISIHSLRLGPDAGIALNGTSSRPLTANVTTFVDLAPGGISRIDMTFATLGAAQINNQGGIIFTDGTCKLTSPDIAFGQGGELRAATGETALTSLAQLSNGTLSGVTIDTSGATVVVPGDITHLVSSHVSVGANSAIDDPGGHNALTGLSSVGAQSSLTVDSDLSLTGSLTASGNVTLGFSKVSVTGTYTQAAGALTLFGSPALSATQVMIEPGAFLTDQGSITGNLVNNGNTGTEGTASVSGNYTQGPSAVLSGGFGGELAVAGHASLAGEAASSEALPRPGDTSPLITFGSRTGTFTSASLGFTLLATANAIDVVTTPQIEASPPAVAPGGTVSVTGGSFRFETTVQIFLDNVSHQALLGTAPVGYQGVFGATIVIPATTTAGAHQLIAVGSDGSQASIPITVS